eukprot:10848857-Lingulodinium_polyedra.AAC.1
MRRSTNCETEVAAVPCPRGYVAHPRPPQPRWRAGGAGRAPQSPHAPRRMPATTAFCSRGVHFRRSAPALRCQRTDCSLCPSSVAWSLRCAPAWVLRWATARPTPAPVPLRGSCPTNPYWRNNTGLSAPSRAARRRAGHSSLRRALC